MPCMPGPAPRAILHVDMDAFYASVEQRDRPELRGRPVLVAHDGPRGVVSAASYESRRFGCRSAMPTARARRLCPEAAIVEPRMEHYVAVSEEVFAIFEAITPLVEPLSIDEAFLDVTGSTRLFGAPPAIAALIKRRVHETTQLSASVGVAPNKFLAKLCSEWEKPDGLVVLEAPDVLVRLAPLPIRRMWGVGPVTEQRLQRAGFASFGDLQAVSLEACCARLGAHGEWFWRLARGDDDRPVVPDAEARSLGAEQTFGEDLADAASVRQVLLAQLERIAARLRRHGLSGRTVTVKIRYGDFETITRSETLEAATDRSDLLRGAAGGLFERWARGGFRPVRLIGGSVSGLVHTGGGQGALFGDPADERARRLDRATDAIRAKFGADVIQRGVSDASERRKGGLDG
jgi:DNA polymerase IV